MEHTYVHMRKILESETNSNLSIDKHGHSLWKKSFGAYNETISYIQSCKLCTTINKKKELKLILEAASWFRCIW